MPQKDNASIYKVLVEQVKDYAIFMLDTRGNVMTWNEGARRIKGYEPHEIIGRHFSTFYTRPDLERELPQNELRIAAETGRYEEEGWRLRKDGTRFWASVVITALRDEAGNLTGFAKVTRDLTQRKLQEDNVQRLLESEERFRLLVEQVKDYAIFALDVKGHIITWNQGAGRLKGYTADEIIGKHFSIFYPPQDLADGKPARELSIAINEGRFEDEGWRVRKDGSLFWASVVITSLWDKRGNLTGFAKVTRDLTERKKEEDALREKTRELESFAHTVSHDLRAPLRSIERFTELLKAEAGGKLNEDEQGYLTRICTASASMERLLKGILQYSQVSLSVLDRHSVSLEEVFKQVTEMLQADIEKSSAKIQIHPRFEFVLGNRTLLIQIFTNLIGNAIKYVPQERKPQVEISMERTGAEVFVLVKDNGSGIQERHFERIFNLFERLGTGPGNAAGTGIGLAIVKKAAERIGGKVEVAASVPNEGTTFKVTLPAAEPVKPTTL